jgi:hypothetical protein
VAVFVRDRDAGGGDVKRAWVHPHLEGAGVAPWRVRIGRATRVGAVRIADRTAPTDAGFVVLVLLERYGAGA